VMFLAKGQDGTVGEREVAWNMHPEPGGHYAAHLEPEVLAEDVRDFYRRYR
jgi:hypothetical protein